MKSEERHRLEKNALADWLGQVIVGVKPYLATLLVGALALGGVAALTSWWMRSSAQGSEAAWNRFYSALASGKASDMEQVIDDFPKTEVAHWATLVASDGRLGRGSSMLFENRSEAVQELRKATDGYTAVLEEARDARLRERAYFGRGRTYESLAGTRQGAGELEKATADYEEVIKLAPKGVFAQIATERLKAIQSPDVKRFYDKFAAYEPRSALADEPGTPGKRPSQDLPDSPESDFTKKVLNTSELKKEPGAAPKTEAPKAEPPRAEPPKAEAGKTPPKTETPKPEPAKPEAPKAAPPKS
jgi:tetratricopeptide (TPR) repeat protein